jgi:hypothetical protein
MTNANNWLYFKDDKNNLLSMPKDRDFQVLFDNGDILNYSYHEFPFAEIIAWREIEQSNTK